MVSNKELYSKYINESKLVNDNQYDKAHQLNTQLLLDLKSIIPAEEYNNNINFHQICQNIIMIVDKYREDSIIIDDKLKIQLIYLKNKLIREINYN